MNSETEWKMYGKWMKNVQESARFKNSTNGNNQQNGISNNSAYLALKKVSTVIFIETH